MPNMFSFKESGAGTSRENVLLIWYSILYNFYEAFLNIL